mmetsp:Transcript_4869/g.8663  ORF Transcript_4869/g.8663 Transcript_4869/m.8663 type:complete len:268 (-) Transcript_4869:1148-1951(-)
MQRRSPVQLHVKLGKDIKASRLGHDRHSQEKCRDAKREKAEEDAYSCRVGITSYGEGTKENSQERCEDNIGGLGEYVPHEVALRSERGEYGGVRNGGHVVTSYCSTENGSHNPVNDLRILGAVPRGYKYQREHDAHGSPRGSGSGSKDCACDKHNRRQGAGVDIVLDQVCKDEVCSDLVHDVSYRPGQNEDNDCGEELVHAAEKAINTLPDGEKGHGVVDRLALRGCRAALGERLRGRCGKFAILLVLQLVEECAHKSGGNATPNKR